MIGYRRYADIGVKFLCSSESLYEKLLHLSEVGEIEQTSTQGDKSHSIQVQEGRRDEVHYFSVTWTSLAVGCWKRFAHVLHESVFFKQEDYAEIESPACKIPTGTVPETSEEPCGKDIEPLMTAITTKGNIYIVTEETSQRDMPSVPKVSYGVTTIRVAEVLVEMETQTASYTYGHIRITREVKVDLQ